MEEPLLRAWEIHNRIQLFVLDAIAPENLSTAPGKSRTVGDHIAHIHNVRLMWMKTAAPELPAGLEKIEKDPPADKAALSAALTASGAAIGTVITQALANGGKVKGFKPDVYGFFGYLVSHESFHQGKIDMILRQAGAPIDDKTHYGMWEWGSR